MHDPTYQAHTRIARKSLQAAIWAAQETLPPAIRSLHFQAAQHSPSPWRAVEAHYCLGHAPTDPVVVATLTDLALMSEALAALNTILTVPTSRSAA